MMFWRAPSYTTMDEALLIDINIISRNGPVLKMSGWIFGEDDGRLVKEDSREKNRQMLYIQQGFRTLRGRGGDPDNRCLFFFYRNLFKPGFYLLAPRLSSWPNSNYLGWWCSYPSPWVGFRVLKLLVPPTSMYASYWPSPWPSQYLEEPWPNG